MRQSNAKNFPLLNKWGWPATANQAKPYFGLGINERWPAEGIAPRKINGYFFYVKELLPLEERKGLDPRWPQGIANPNRFMVVCPVCDKHFTYGRLAQHLAVHNKPRADLTEAEYEQALLDNGFTRGRLPGHVSTKFADGTVGHISEAAAQDMFPTRREVLADLIATRDWENDQHDYQSNLHYTSESGINP